MHMAKLVTEKSGAIESTLLFWKDACGGWKAASEALAGHAEAP